MNFNERAIRLDYAFQVRGKPGLLGPAWFRYQVHRSRVAYLPALRRHAARKHPLRMAADMIRLTTRWRCLPFHYLRYGLYDVSVTTADALRYLPETVLYYRLLPRCNRDVVLLDDKLITKRILASSEVAQPALVASGNRSGYYDPAGRPVSHDAVSSLLHAATPVVVKPSRFSSGGDGVVVLANEGEALVDQNGDTFDVATYTRQWGAWIAEDFVRQHPSTARLNPHTLNAFRVITLNDPDTGTSVEHIILKLGSGDVTVDNAHRGGLYLATDPATGRLADIAFDETFNRHTNHPANGIRFSDCTIDQVTAVAELARRAASLFPTITLIGWDIALGEHGPKILEGNSSPGLTNIQRTHGGVAPSLGRRLADRARATAQP